MECIYILLLGFVSNNLFGIIPHRLLQIKWFSDKLIFSMKKSWLGIKVGNRSDLGDKWTTWERHWSHWSAGHGRGNRVNKKCSQAGVGNQLADPDTELIPTSRQSSPAWVFRECSVFNKANETTWIMFGATVEIVGIMIVYS